MSRSSSPAMQASSAGLNVTLGSTTPSFTTLSSLQNTVSNISTTASNMFGINYMPPTTYSSTNPFLTGAYLNYSSNDYNPDKFNTIGSTKEIKSFFENYATDSTTKYGTLSSKTSYDGSNDPVFTTSESKYNTIGFKYPEKTTHYLTTSSSDMKYSPAKNNNYDTSPNMTQSSNSTLLNVEETPTPTSSIETEDSTTREVGEKDVEGDGEQSD